MRDLLFKNLTSSDRKRKILASSEIFDKSGVRTVVHRHFIYFLKEVSRIDNAEKQPSYLSVFKQRNSRDKTEKFFCRMKGSVYAVSQGKLYLVIFMHSLKITLSAISDELMKYT